MKKFLICILLSCFLWNLNAQEYHSDINGFDIHVMPLTMIDFTPRVRLGVEYKHNRTGYCLEYGMGNYCLNRAVVNELRWGEDYAFYEVRAEVKHYFIEMKNSGLYCSSELFFLKMSDKLTDNFFYHENPSLLIGYKHATFNKYKTGLHLKLGAKILALSKLSIEFYAGAGLAFRKIYYNNLIQPYIYDPFIIIGKPRYRIEGESILPHLTLGLKIGYKF